MRDNDDEAELTPWEQYEQSQQNSHFSRGMSIEQLRDRALWLFNSYIAYRLKEKHPVKLSPKMLERQRDFLSVVETENIVRELSADIGAPEGVYAIGGNSPEKAREQMNKLLEALMTRILSNVTNTAVNFGLLDCSFDNQEGAFGFDVTPLGKKVIEKCNKLDKKKKKKKKHD